MARIIKAEGAAGEGAARAAALKLTDFADQARTLVLEARTEAGRIISEARVKAEDEYQESQRRGHEEGHARGQNDGYVDGLRQGRQEGVAEAARGAANLASWAEKAVEELASAKQEAIRLARDEMLSLAMAIARKVVGHVSAADIDSAKTNLSKVLELACGPREMTIHVHPDQLEALREYGGQVAAATSLAGRLEFVPDESISKGGVKIISRNGEIDATIETQLDNIARALTGQAGEYCHDGMEPSQEAAADAAIGPYSTNEPL
jgi:flagellar assembly protein FliH